MRVTHSWLRSRANYMRAYTLCDYMDGTHYLNAWHDITKLRGSDEIFLSCLACVVHKDYWRERESARFVVTAPRPR